MKNGHDATRPARSQGTLATRSTLTLALLFLLVAPSMPSLAEDTTSQSARRRRPRTITYDRQLDLNSRPLEGTSRMREELTKPRDPLEALERAEGNFSPALHGMALIPGQSAPPPGPRRQRRERERSDDWLAESSDVKTLLGVRDEQSDWGWLASAVMSIRSEEAERMVTEQSRMDQEAEALRGAEQRPLVATSLMMDLRAAEREMQQSRDQEGESFRPATQTRRESETASGQRAATRTRRHASLAEADDNTFDFAPPSRRDTRSSLSEARETTRRTDQTLRSWEREWGLGEPGSRARTETASRPAGGTSSQTGRTPTRQTTSSAGIRPTELDTRSMTHAIPGPGDDTGLGHRSSFGTSAYSTSPFDRGYGSLSHPGDAHSYQTPSYQTRSYHSSPPFGSSSRSRYDMTSSEDIHTRRETLRALHEEGATGRSGQRFSTTPSWRDR